MTREEFEALPEDGLRHELQSGWLISEPPPGFRHGGVAVRVAQLLSSFVRAHRLGVVTGHSGFVLAHAPDTLRGPDVAFVSRERAEQVEDVSGAFPGPPDLAVEVVGPADLSEEIHAKVADYLAAGARLVWLVDPEAEVIVVYRTLLAPRRFGSDEWLDGGDVLPGFRVPVHEIFDV